jgi:4'-phosphopantetheinyl transferase EntD
VAPDPDPDPAPAPAPDTAPASRALRRVLPASATGSVVTIGDDTESPYPAERALVATRAPGRRREFYAGRRAAHLALEALGADGTAITAGLRGAPSWPAGVVGSVSHAGGLAVAAVAPASAVWGLGIDVETLGPPLTPDVQRLVLCGGDETFPGDPHHRLARYWPNIAFSAKESVFKCLFPRTGWLLEFHDVVVSVDLEAGRYTAAVNDRFRVPGLDLTKLAGTFAASDGYLFTSMCIRETSDAG